MIQLTREDAQQVLALLSELKPLYWDSSNAKSKYTTAIASLQSAIDAPVQEPVQRLRHDVRTAWLTGTDDFRRHYDNALLAILGCKNFQDLYTPQPPVSAKPPHTCTWTEDAEGYYATECGEAYVFNDGTPKQNNAYFCHHCGGKLIEAAHGIKEPTK